MHKPNDRPIPLRAAALLAALLLMLTAALPVYAASSADVSGTDISGSDAAGVSGSDVSPTDVPEEPVNLELGTVEANAAILYDADTGKILYEQNADAPLPPASTTKIMTALLVLEAVETGVLSLDEQIEAGSTELNSIPWDASTVHPKIAAGESMSLRDYLACVMLTSDCASCNVLAKRVSGSVDGFVERMNARAAELGCENVTFLNAHGYPKAGHVATARSLLTITLAAMQYPAFTELVGAHDYTIAVTNKTAEERKLINTNSLLVGASGYAYRFATGVKTGYSSSSGCCLVASATKEGRSLVSVVLGAERATENGKTVMRSFTESTRLLEWGFNAFAWRTIASEGFYADRIPLAESTSDTLTLVYKESALALLPVQLDLSTLEQRITLHRTSATAPVSQGDEFGTVEISRDGEVLAVIPIVAGADAAVKEPMSPWLLAGVLGGGVLAIAMLTLAIRSARGRRATYGYDAVIMAEAERDPRTYPYGDRPLYKRRGSGRAPASPSFSDGGYYTRNPAADSRRYTDYELEYRNERDNRNARYYEEYGEEHRPEPIFPRDGKWQPPRQN